ncbi:hypothetical protein CHARACLAT_029608 [Characodon lateralis]|uniref:NADH dehydrogenase subunit 6 n=1 Tax=Characodon lateralis TaxID=208331 RepID=A0ABU7D537_9TELE|nr:hypothetical protein [Characodon lateralis]
MVGYVVLLLHWLGGVCGLAWLYCFCLACMDVSGSASRGSAASLLCVMWPFCVAFGLLGWCLFLGNGGVRDVALRGLHDCLAGPGGFGSFVYGGCMCLCWPGDAYLGRVWLIGGLDVGVGCVLLPRLPGCGCGLVPGIRDWKLCWLSPVGSGVV